MHLLDNNDASRRVLLYIPWQQLKAVLSLRVCIFIYLLRDPASYKLYSAFMTCSPPSWIVILYDYDCEMRVIKELPDRLISSAQRCA